MKATQGRIVTIGGPPYDADATMAVPDLSRNSFSILCPAEGYRHVN